MKIFQYFKNKLLKWCLPEEEITIGELYNKYESIKNERFDENGDLKFIEEVPLDDLLIQTPSRISPIKRLLKTIEYDVYRVTLDNGLSLDCADNHILMNILNKEVFAKDSFNELIQTKNGNSRVISVEKLNYSENMFDLEIDGDDHTFFTNGMLSHNTTCAAMYLLWKAIFFDDQTILIASNTADSAGEVMSRIKYAYEYLPDWLRPSAPTYAIRTVRFDNGSQILTRATTANTGRGLSISILYCDEMAAVEPIRKQREFWAAIRPTLSTGGQCIITSTPKSDEDAFAEIWNIANNTFDAYGNEIKGGIGRNGFKAVQYNWDIHPDRDEAWEFEERAAIGDDRFMREHECKFITDDETLINPITLASMMGIDPDYTTGKVRWYGKIKPNKKYLISLDPAMGTGGDYAAIEVFQLPEMIQVAEWQHNKTNINKQMIILKELLEYIYDTMDQDVNQTVDPEIYWTVENNSIGEACNVVIRETGEDKFKGMYMSEKLTGKSRTKIRRKGFNTTTKNKIEACARFKSLVERDKIIIFSKPLISELKVFVSKGPSYAAKRGEHDDLVMASLLIVRLMERLMEWDASIEQALSESLDEDEASGNEPILVSVLSTFNYN